jgi:hypothetical protein
MLRTLRLAMMSAMAILMIIALLPTGSPAWLDFPGEPVTCYFHLLPASWNATGLNQPRNAQFLALFTLVILASAYLTRFVKLFEKSSASVRLVLRIIPGKLVKRGLDVLLQAAELLGPKWSRWATPFFYMPFLAGFVVGKAICDLIESMLWEVCIPYPKTYRV